MQLDDLHMIIDQYQYDNPEKKFEVALIDESTMKVQRIREIYVDLDLEVMTLVYDSRKGTEQE